MSKNRNIPIKPCVAVGLLCFIVVRMWTASSAQTMPPAPPVRAVAGSRLSAALEDGVGLEALGTSPRSLIFSADGRRIASLGWDYVQAWDTAPSKRICAIPLQFDASTRKVPLSIALSPNGSYLAAAFWDAHVEVWAVDTGKRRASLNGTTRRTNTRPLFTWDWHCVAFSPDGQTLATAVEDETVQLWDLGTFQEIMALKGHLTPLRSVVFSPDGKTLASAGHDSRHGEIKLWDVAMGQERLDIPETVPAYSLAFSPDGTTLACGQMLGVVSLWDVATGTKKQSLHLKRPGSLLAPSPADLAFSPDGSLLASIGSEMDETGADASIPRNMILAVRFWDVQNGAEQFAIKERSTQFAGAISPDWKSLAFYTEDLQKATAPQLPGRLRRPRILPLWKLDIRAVQDIHE